MIRQAVDRVGEILGSPRSIVAIVALGATTLAGCGGGNLGNKIEKCDGLETPIHATFKGQPDYAPETDPAVLANNGTHVSDPKNDGANTFTGGVDYADKVGEVACMDKRGRIVLNAAGARIQNYYLAGKHASK